MAMITRRAFCFRPIVRRHPYYVQNFSSSSEDNGPSAISRTESQPEHNSGSQTPTRISFSSTFSDVKASLQREPPPPNRIPRPPSVSYNNPRRRSVDFQEIRRNLAEFRMRSVPPPPPSSSPGQPVLFQELYNRNVILKDDQSSASDSPAVGSGMIGPIKESLNLLKSRNFPLNRNQVGSRLGGFDLSPLGNSSMGKSKQNLGQDPAAIFGGSQSSAKAISELLKAGSEPDDASANSMLLTRQYDYSELGDKLKTLRPEKKKGNWFTLQELSDRLVKLREIEEEENKMTKAGITFSVIRKAISSIGESEAQIKKNQTIKSLQFLSNVGATPEYMLKEPQEKLVEKYFHPDNMSSEEKLKLELKKVRDEFKMSESDCGSARVQVAQLTTKIKHLSTVLHKKDKHSRKGLDAMVQRRKKLLKYLRRTDWDSYTLVLSKLGLRDNAVVKA